MTDKEAIKTATKLFRYVNLVKVSKKDYEEDIPNAWIDFGIKERCRIYTKDYNGETGDCFSGSTWEEAINNGIAEFKPYEYDKKGYKLPK